MKIYVEIEIISNKAISSYLSGGIYMMNTDTDEIKNESENEIAMTTK